MNTEHEYYESLADAAEAGELRPAGQPTYRDGSAIASEASIEDAVYVAMGRPRLDAEGVTPQSLVMGKHGQGKGTKTWKIRTTGVLDATAHDAAQRHGMNLSEYVRRAVAEKIQRDKGTV